VNVRAWYRHCRELRFAGIIVILAAQHSAAQQMAPTPQPEKVSNRVMQLAAEGKVGEADRALQEALAQCQQPSAPRNCRALLSFTQAYLAQQKGAAGVGEAREFYRRVLTDQPNNGPALNNLALVEDSAGNATEAERLWQQAIRSEPERASHYAVLLGDHYLRLKNLSSALQAYDQAEQALPTADAPRRRIVSAYRQTERTENLDTLLARAQGWEKLDPINARSAYELLMARWSQDPASGTKADLVLVSWVVLLARSDWLNLESLSGLPANWASPGVSQLRSYLERPEERPNWGWWGGNEGRLSARFEIADAAGRRLLKEKEGGPQKAQSCWHWALQSTSPMDLIRWQAASNGYLRISQNLASLYFDHPELDPDNKQLSEMLARLYEGKMAAIESGDRSVTQAYHTTLAFIYVGRGTWNALPGTPGYMSARFQLQAVLDDARYREREEGYFQPLPEIKAMLAKGLMETGSKSEAARVSFQAAIAYLDSDSITDSQALLDQSKSLDSANPELGRLQNVIVARREPTKFSLDQLTAERMPWLFLSSGNFSDAFLKRQRFKIYADCVTPGDVGPQGLVAALEAYGLVAEQQTSLVGAGDLLRWQRVESALLMSVNGQPMPPRIVPGKGIRRAPGARTTLPIALTGEDSPNAVAVQKETPTAVQVLRTIGVGKIRDVQPYLRLRRDGLYITPTVGNADIAPLLERLKSDPNLRAFVKPGTTPS
jgi:tetratricopeptide (TPR) repeat protein